MTHTTNPTLVLGIVVVFGIAAVVHLVRRHGTLNTKTRVSTDLFFDRMQRFLHWSIAFGAGALFVTGLPVYLSQFLVNPPVPTSLRFVYWGVVVNNWRNVHIYLALLVTGLVIWHASWDAIYLRRMVKVRLTKQDFRDTIARAKNFLGFSRNEPNPMKYDPLQKAFHWSLVILGAFLLLSGVIEWEALTWQGLPLFVWVDRFSPPLMDTFLRTGHLVVAMLFAGLSVVHVYFALLPQNRPILRAIIASPNRSVGVQAVTTEKQSTRTLFNRDPDARCSLAVSA